MAETPISQCSVFIQIWVDTNVLHEGSTVGVYLVDNRTSTGIDEGTPMLTTTVSQSTYICWQIANVDPESATGLSIQSISNSPVWGASGQPFFAGGQSWTGQAQSAGRSQYQLIFNAEYQHGMGVTTIVTPTIVVTSPSNLKKSY